MSRGLDRGRSTDEEVFFSFEDEEVLHLFGMVVGSVEVNEFFEFSGVDSKAHGINIEINQL